MPNNVQKLDLQDIKTSQMTMEKLIEKCSENPRLYKHNNESYVSFDDSLISFKSALEIKSSTLQTVSSYNEKVQKLLHEIGKLCYLGFEDDEIIIN